MRPTVPLEFHLCTREGLMIIYRIAVKSCDLCNSLKVRGRYINAIMVWTVGRFSPEGMNVDLSSSFFLFSFF